MTILAASLLFSCTSSPLTDSADDSAADSGTPLLTVGDGDFEQVVGENPLFWQVAWSGGFIGAGPAGQFTSSDGATWTNVSPIGLMLPVRDTNGDLLGVFSGRQGNTGAPELHRSTATGSTQVSGPWDGGAFVQPVVGDDTLYVYGLSDGTYTLWARDGSDFSAVTVPADFLQFASSPAGVYAFGEGKLYRVRPDGLTELTSLTTINAVTVDDTGRLALYGKDDDGVHVRTSSDDFATHSVIWRGAESFAVFAGSDTGALFGVDFDNRVHASLDRGDFTDVGPLPNNSVDLVPKGSELFARVGLLWGQSDANGLRSSLPNDPSVRYAAGQDFRERRTFALTHRPETTFDVSQVIYTDDLGETWYAGALSPQAPIENFCGGLSGYYIGGYLNKGKSYYAQDLMSARTDGDTDFFNASLPVDNDLDWPIHDCLWRGMAVVLAAGEDGDGGLFHQGLGDVPSWGQYTDPWVQSEPTAIVGAWRNTNDSINIYRQDGDFTTRTSVDGFPSPSYLDSGTGRSFSRVIDAVPGMVLWEDKTLVSYPNSQSEPETWTVTGLPSSDWLHLQRGEGDGYVWVGTATGLYRSTEEVLIPLIE